MDLLQILTAQVQIVGPVGLSLWLYVPLLVIIPLITDVVIGRLIRRGKYTKKRTEKWIATLNVQGAFIITFALTANSSLRFGPLPAAASLFNPLIGFYPIYIAYQLQKAIFDGQIKGSRKKRATVSA